MIPIRLITQERVRYATPCNSRVGQIFKQREFVPTEKRIQPIVYHTYESDLRRADMLLGVDPLFTENTLKNVEVIPYKKPSKEIKVQADDIITKVSTRFKIHKGKIEVTITCPIENLYTNYYSKGEKPPLKERILAYEKIGYTNQQLAKMIKNDDYWKKKSAENDKFIETIFGDVNKKKTTTAPKKKTLAQLIGFKKPKYATNDNFDEAEED